MEIQHDTEELRKEKSMLSSQIQKLVREFEEKYNCYAELRQQSVSTMTTCRTITVEMEIHV